MPERISPPLEPSQVLPLFIDAVRDYALLMLDPVGNVTSWNQGAQLIKGYAAEEIIGRPFSCFYPPEDVAAGKPQRELYHAAVAGRFEDVGYRIRKDGSRFLANVVITAVRGAGGELLGYGKVTRDVTERIEAEERVRANEIRLRTLIDTLFDTVVDGLITMNRHGQIQSYNNACVRQFGYAREEVIGNNVKMLMPEPDRSRHDSYVSHYLATGSAAIIGIGRNVFGQRKDGSVFPMRLAIGENPGDEHAFVGIIHDLSEQQYVQDRLRVSEGRLHLLLDAVPAAIAMFDRDMRYLAHSRRFADDYNLGDQPLLGRSHYEVFPELPERWHEIHRRCLAGTIVRSDEDAVTRPNGEIAWLRWEMRPWNDARGEIGGIVMFTEIITDRKRAEQVLAETERQLRQAQKMEAIGNLSGGLAHDFNNMLGIIIGNLDLAGPLLRDNDAATELVEEAIGAAVSGAELTRRLLAFARKQSLRPERIAPNDLISGIVRLLRRTLGENVEIVLDLADALWPVVADAAQLEACLINLATNARDAMPNGGQLSIATVNWCLDADYAASNIEVTAGDYAAIVVSDTGTGMAPEIVQHIFEPFFTTKEPGKGTGLGLSMVFGFIKQSGGHINVYSEPGVGTTFRLYLPRAAAETAQAVEPQRTLPPLHGSGESVLAVEDNPRLRQVVVRQLSELGYRPIEADGPAAALEILEREQIDLLFTDVVMPGPLDGIALARQVTKRWPTVKVLLTSGFAGSKLDEQFDARGATMRLLSKPYRVEDLAKMLRQILAG